MADDTPCRADCPICTDATEPQDWDGPYQAFRWSPDLEEIDHA